MTSADKFAYVAQAGEATGAGRALVECILADPVKAEASAKARLKISKARTTWDDTIIKVLYREALKDIGDVAFINLAAEIAGGISECQFEGLCRPSHVAGRQADVVDRMLTPLVKDKEVTGQKPPLMQVVFFGAWMLTEPAKQAAFLAGRGQDDGPGGRALHRPQPADRQPAGAAPRPAERQRARASCGSRCSTSRRTAAPPTPRASPTCASGAPARSSPTRRRSRRRSAARAARPACSRASRSRRRRGPPAAGVNAPPDPNYNVDLDGDGINDAYVEPMVMNGVNVSKAIGGPGDIDVHAKPDDASPVLGKLPDRASVNITGKSGPWTCIEFGPNKKPGFAEEHPRAL